MEDFIVASTSASATAGKAVVGVIDTVTDFANDHPIITAAVAGFVAIAVIEKVAPAIAPVTNKLDGWRRDAQTAVADFIAPSVAAPQAPIPLRAPVNPLANN